jgi:transmembrane sensor
MNNITQMPDKGGVYDDASFWTAKLERGLTSLEEVELKKWLKQDSSNQAVLFEMTQQWDNMDALSCLSDIFPHTTQKTSKPQSKPVLAIAASIIFALFTVALSYTWFGQDAEENVLSDSSQESNFDLVDYETAIGELSSVVLPDGTTILLNTNTLVSVAYTPTERLIRLQRGELHVKVTHNPLRPLRVSAKSHVVEAVGTAFNVKLTENQGVELLVTDGKVLVAELEKSVKKQYSPRQASAQALSNTQSLAVSAGEEVLLGSEHQELMMVDPEDIAVKLSWQEGNLIFTGESLQEAMAEVGRYTSTEFVFLDDKAKAVRIAGHFKAGDLETLLVTLRDSFEINYKQVSGSRVELGSQ